MIGQPKPRGSIVLKIVIVLLIGVLVYTIWEPFDIIRTQDQLRTESRLRMSNIRNAQMFYFAQHQTYQRDLDSLIYWITTDSLVIAKQDSLFKPLQTGEFIAESLKFSPQSHETYILEVDDTSTTHRYYLECPDGYGFVGSLTDVSQLHRASWE
jgi:hypothetical protein